MCRVIVHTFYLIFIFFSLFYFDFSLCRLSSDSSSIWNHLVRLSTDHGRTVIITTHYIEEARQAHTVSETQ